MSKKYPRTMHTPWSEGVTSDDKIIKSMDNFHGKRVIVSIKMDGENTTMTNGSCHARSLDSKYHPSRAWVMGKWASIAHTIPEHIRICGENLYAKHSIAYENLESYFLGFSVWDDWSGVVDCCLDWDSTLDMFKKLGIQPVEVIYDGIYDEAHIKALWNQIKDQHEGYVIRVAEAFLYEDFQNVVAKFVRKNHVQTDQHWMHQEVVPNKLIMSSTEQS